jgi:four helix bundle protein
MERLFERLVAWKESYALCLRIYAVTKNFPSEEKFALVNQMRRAASSVPINIAEGNTKSSKKDRARFFEISLSSLNELDCECLLARDLGYLPEEDFVELNDRIRRTSYLINQLIASLR